MNTVDIQACRAGQTCRPALLIHIPAYCGDRSDQYQTLEHGIITHITGMQYIIAAGQPAEGLRPQQPVGIGYKADDFHTGHTLCFDDSPDADHDECGPRDPG